jgi:hypothetical protein
VMSSASDPGPALPRVWRPTRSYANPRSLGRDRSGRTTDKASPTVAGCPGPSVSRDIGAGPWGPKACADRRRGGQRYGDLHTTRKAGPGRRASPPTHRAADGNPRQPPAPPVGRQRAPARPSPVSRTYLDLRRGSALPRACESPFRRSAPRSRKIGRRAACGESDPLIRHEVTPPGRGSPWWSSSAEPLGRVGPR